MLELSACSVVLLTSVPTLLSAQPTPSAADIIAKAIEAQERHERAGNEVKYDYELVSITEKLDDDGEPRETEQDLYRSHHIQGVAYERLIEKDGRDLDAKELEKENEREEEFRDKLAKGEAKHNDADDRVAFNEELLGRYDIELTEIRSLSGRDCYVLRFEPKPGKLPVRRTIDRALNQAEGHLWIESESFEIARIEFELRDKVQLWWGMMGSISKMSGALQRHPMPDGIWLPKRFDFYMKGRMLFRSIHVRQKVIWEDFEKRREAIATSP